MQARRYKQWVCQLQRKMAFVKSLLTGQKCQGSVLVSAARKHSVMYLWAMSSRRQISAESSVLTADDCLCHSIRKRATLLAAAAGMDCSCSRNGPSSTGQAI